MAALDEATTRVLERLADPAAAEAYQSKGLVVGYVQSGKTANFTGVVAKAMDAGYRLVIVLGGTLNLLRGQTQRRLDMELVGEENILRGRDRDDPAVWEDLDYGDDRDWHEGRFLRHGCLPSLMGAFDIERLTTRDDDYKRLRAGISALDFEKTRPEYPLYHPDNLHASKARLMVVKKNKAVLTKLLKDLGKIHTPLDQIPVLIVDDESDQASVNTSNPKKWRDGQADRTAINGLLAQLLARLPRAQYVGYTATPFANVFIDPSDAMDIFPKDFIISLQRPDGYMGVRDFHDLDSDVPVEARTIANSQEAAHVRGVELSDDLDDTWLQQALDMYVLAGAVKLYREAHNPALGDGYFRHHTMLVHESVRVAEHRELSHRLTKLWYDSAYTGAQGHARLRALFDRDVRPVSEFHAAGQPTPTSFDELIPCLGPVIVRVGGDGNPVITVNGDADVEKGTADFDKRPIWKILVGGTKLSRGFTVEGLTVTYYRRTTAQADTLMQMGRWFGFRHGYLGSGAVVHRAFGGVRHQDGRPVRRLRGDLSGRGSLPRRAAPVRGVGRRPAAGDTGPSAAVGGATPAVASPHGREQDVQRRTRGDPVARGADRADGISGEAEGQGAQHAAVAALPGPIGGAGRVHLRQRGDGVERARSRPARPSCRTPSCCRCWSSRGGGTLAFRTTSGVFCGVSKRAGSPTGCCWCRRRPRPARCGPPSAARCRCPWPAVAVAVPRCSVPCPSRSTGRPRSASRAWRCRAPTRPRRRCGPGAGRSGAVSGRGGGLRLGGTRAGACGRVDPPGRPGHGLRDGSAPVCGGGRVGPGALPRSQCREGGTGRRRRRRARPLTENKRVESLETTPQTRARMSRQKSRDTQLELNLRKALHASGLRYRVHRRPLKGIRREADVVFGPAKVAVFVDGCFWHGCPEHATWPKNNAEFWRNKIEGNRVRDADTDARLAAAGWLAVRVWEHESPAEAAERVRTAVVARRA
ncbi:DNA mismatch endonuclease Vsr [Yinghuangia aomiensis]